MKKSQYVLADLNFDRSAFSNAKMFNSNFVNKFLNFLDCLGNFIFPAFWYNVGLHEQMLFFSET